MKRVTKLVVVLAVLSIAVAACGKSGPKNTAFTLKLGVVTSFTGDLAAYGKPVNRAVELARDVLNDALKAAGSKMTVTVSAEDDQTTPAAGVEAANKLVADGATVLIGALASGVCIPIVTAVSAPKGVVEISPSATAAALTTVQDNGYFFRTVISDFLQAKLIAKTMGELFGKTSKVNVGARNDTYGTGIEDAFVKLWKDGGGTIGHAVKWDPKGASFDSEAGQLVDGSPAAWLIVDFPDTWKKVGNALLRTGKWDIKKTFATDGLKDGALKKDAGPKLSQDLRGSAPGPSEKGAAPAAPAFDALWTQKAGIPRQTFDAQSFDAAMVAALAAVAAGSNKASEIRDRLTAVSGAPGTKYTFENLTQAVKDLLDGKDIDYEGASSGIDFDSNGDNGTKGATYEIWTYTGGKVVITKSIKASEVV